MGRTDTEKIDRLVGRAKDGERAAFSELVRLLMNDITALTYKMTGDRDAAFDLAQDSFVSAWEKLGSFRGEARFENWLYRIATNKALNYRSRVSVSRTDSLDQEGSAESVSSAMPDRIFEQRQLRDNILSFMQTLPPKQRAVFELRFYRQLEFKEIADITGNALGTVKTNYREAVAKLRDFAREKGLRS